MSMDSTVPAAEQIALHYAASLGLPVAQKDELASLLVDTPLATCFVQLAPYIAPSSPAGPQFATVVQTLLNLKPVPVAPDYDATTLTLVQGKCKPVAQLVSRVARISVGTAGGSAEA
jgi:hypothetical protein